MRSLFYANLLQKKVIGNNGDGFSKKKKKVNRNILTFAHIKIARK